MPLKFSSSWRFKPPNTERISDVALEDFVSYILTTSNQGDKQSIIEHFKGYFSHVNGRIPGWSSNVSWAETDLIKEMYDASENAPLFLEAYYDACLSLNKNFNFDFIPDVELINGVCEKHNIGYYVEPPFLKLRDTSLLIIPVEQHPNTLEEDALEILNVSLHRAEELHKEGRGKEAVQETLWLLESVTTTFKGIETDEGKVGGKYFNQIVRNLRSLSTSPTLDRVLDWVSSLHGYLSSPTGGGVRHGADLKKIREMTPGEARLFCNLIRSYLSYLLEEHERLNKK